MTQTMTDVQIATIRLPRDMAQFDPYLCFDGNCAEAMRFYERTLGGKIEMMMKFSEAPPEPGAATRAPEAAR